MVDPLPDHGEMGMSKIITKIKKQTLLRILDGHKYLTNYDIAHIDSPDFLKTSMKIPFSWLLNAYCINTKDGKDGLEKPAPENFDLRKLLVTTETLPFLEMVGNPESKNLDIRYTSHFIDGEGYDLQSKRLEVNRDKVSKSELYEIIKAIFPDYCPPHGCLAPIRAAHRDWYVVILLLACTNSTQHCPLSNKGCANLIKRFRELKTRKSRKICAK